MWRYPNNFLIPSEWPHPGLNNLWIRQSYLCGTNHHPSAFSMRALLFSWPHASLLDMNRLHTIIRITPTRFPLIPVRIYTHFSWFSTDRDYFPQNNTEWDHFPHFFFKPNFKSQRSNQFQCRKKFCYVYHRCSFHSKHLPQKIWVLPWIHFFPQTGTY